MTKPRLRKVGDGWECRSTHDTIDGKMSVSATAKSQRVAYDEWHESLKSCIAVIGWADHSIEPPIVRPVNPARRLRKPPPKPTLIDRFRNWLAR